MDIYSDEEDFANGVLMIVHQIPYEKSVPQKYPVETIVQNEGDCDLFSFVAASIMMAGGLDVVLFYYEAEKHMNVGVYLSPYQTMRGQKFTILTTKISHTTWLKPQEAAGKKDGEWENAQTS